MQGIYTYIPETNCVPREYCVAAILLFLFMVLISLVSVLNLLYFYISTFRSMCAVPNVAVFCSSLTSWFPGMLLTYCYYYYYYYLLGGSFRSGSALQAKRSRVRFPVGSLGYFIDVILPAALWPWGRLSL